MTKIPVEMLQRDLGPGEGVRVKIGVHQNDVGLIRNRITLTSQREFCTGWAHFEVEFPDGRVADYRRCELATVLRAKLPPALLSRGHALRGARTRAAPLFTAAWMGAS